MRIISVDPGETIGLAQLDSNNCFDVHQTKDIWEAEDWIWQAAKIDQAILLIEDYNSSGYMTKQAFNTVYRLGRLSGYMERDFGFPFHTVPPQARLSSVREATELIATLGAKKNYMARNGRDAIAALAHAISYARVHDPR